eukprot:XP_001695579.1 predicted protein [Chlamydomonas reinhardtii]
MPCEWWCSQCGALGLICAHHVACELRRITATAPIRSPYYVPHVALLKQLHNRAVGRTDVSGCVLFDPVDGSPMTPESADYPSATKALAAAGRSAGLVGAAITGSCNPVGQNYPKFWGALAPGSWQMVLSQAGHMQFARTGNPFLDWSLDRLCGRGTMMSSDVITYSAAFTVAWFEGIFRPAQSQMGISNFKTWANTQIPGLQDLIERKPAALRSGRGNAPQSSADLHAFSQTGQPNAPAVRALRGLGYEASLAFSIGSHSAPSALRLSHEFVVVRGCGAGAPLIVEPSFREHFAIGSLYATERYRQVLAAVPEELVAPYAQLCEMVRLVCAEMKFSFEATGNSLPPWRIVNSVLSRWASVGRTA